ncbi:MAG: 50S ribosomal protein L24 [Vulcanimicrobiota bacterium]
MPKAHVKKNDTVQVITGKYEGKRSKVLQVHPNGTVTVEGVNVVKRHTKPKPPKMPQGGIVEKTLPVDASNVMLVCPQCGVPIRPAYRYNSEGEKQRYCRKCNETIP